MTPEETPQGFIEWVVFYSCYFGLKWNRRFRPDHKSCLLIHSRFTQGDQVLKLTFLFTWLKLQVRIHVWLHDHHVICRNVPVLHRWFLHEQKWKVENHKP